MSVSNLRAKRKQLSIIGAADADDHKAMLLALRRLLAEELEEGEPDPKEKTSLSRQIREINKELRTMTTNEGGFIEQAIELVARANGSIASPF